MYIQRLQAALLSINYKRKYIEERFQAAREELHTEMRVNKRLRGMLEARLGVGPELLVGGTPWPGGACCWRAGQGACLQLLRAALSCVWHTRQPSMQLRRARYAVQLMSS